MSVNLIDSKRNCINSKMIKFYEKKPGLTRWIALLYFNIHNLIRILDKNITFWSLTCLFFTVLPQFVPSPCYVTRWTIIMDVCFFACNKQGRFCSNIKPSIRSLQQLRHNNNTGSRLTFHYVRFMIFIDNFILLFQTIIMCVSCSCLMFINI